MVLLCGVWKTGGTERNTKKTPTTNKHAPQLTMQTNQQLIPTSYIHIVDDTKTDIHAMVTHVQKVATCYRQGT